MATFEERVATAASEDINVRYEALKKLDPEIARRYVIMRNRRNEEHLRKGERLEGFGKFKNEDMDFILEAALDLEVDPTTGEYGQSITAKEEEALMIILDSYADADTGPKEHMIRKIEENLWDLWSSKSIRHEVSSLLQRTTGLQFTSRGVNHQGTGLRYTGLDFRDVAGLIKAGSIGAWEVSSKRSYLRLPAGDHGADGFAVHETDDIYIVRGLSRRDREAKFCHEATHAWQDFKNVPRASSLAKFTESDAYIVQAYVALRFGQPYTARGRPETVACSGPKGAAVLLLEPIGTRDAGWEQDFKVAYDAVVDAYVSIHGRSANDVIDMLESSQGQKREKKLLEKMHNKLNKKKQQKP